MILSSQCVCSPFLHSFKICILASIYSSYISKLIGTALQLHIYSFYRVNSPVSLITPCLVAVSIDPRCLLFESISISSSSCLPSLCVCIIHSKLLSFTPTRCCISPIQSHAHTFALPLLFRC